MHYEADEQLVNKWLLTRNTLYNLLGRGLPLIVAIITIPLVVEGLGEERYGLLNLVLLVIGYFNLFDLGVGRATTKFVADYLVSKQLSELRALIWTSWVVLFSLGVTGGLTLVIITPLLTEHILNIPVYLLDEATISLYMVALAIPVVICTSGMRGVLQAQQRFDLVNIIAIPAGIINHVIPLVALMFTQNLPFIIAVLVFCRGMVLVVYIHFCLNKTLPFLKEGISFDKSKLKVLLGFGGWLTVTSVIGPVMEYMDRFLIGAMLTLSAVSYYVVPYSVVIKLLLIPQSLLTVLFPAFSSMSIQEKNKLPMFYSRAVKYVLLAMFPLATVLIIFANDIMALWMGIDFARESADILRVLGLGILINSLALVPFTLIQALGRPDITAKFHLVEVLPYLIVLWVMVSNFGIIGAAITWGVRVSMDTLLLFWYADKLLPSSCGGKKFIFYFLPAFIIFFIVITILSKIAGLAIRLEFVAFLLIIYVFFTWRFGLAASERKILNQGVQWVISTLKRA